MTSDVRIDDAELDPLAAVTHANPYRYYQALAAHRPWYRDDRLGCWVACSAETVSAVLSSDICRVRPQDEPIPRALLGARSATAVAAAAAPTAAAAAAESAKHAPESAAAVIFRHLVRMTDGAAHCPLKHAVSATLDALDETRIREEATRWAEQLLADADNADAPQAAQARSNATAPKRADHAASAAATDRAVAMGGTVATDSAATTGSAITTDSTVAADSTIATDGPDATGGAAERGLPSFAFRLPVFVIASLLGVPRERLGEVAALMHDFARAIAPGSTPNALARGVRAAEPLLALFRALVNANDANAASDEHAATGASKRASGALREGASEGDADRGDNVGPLARPACEAARPGLEAPGAIAANDTHAASDASERDSGASSEGGGRGYGLLAHLAGEVARAGSDASDAVAANDMRAPGDASNCAGGAPREGGAGAGADGGGLLARLAREAAHAGIDAPDAIAANAIGFMSQAYEAAAGLIGNTALALATHPDVRAQVMQAMPASRSPSPATSASPSPSLSASPSASTRTHAISMDRLHHTVLEVLRHDPPVHNTRRFVATDGSIAGHPVRTGDTILVVLAAANYDPMANPEPARFELFRRERRTFTFGASRHACPGERIAIAIATAGVHALLAHGRIPESIAGAPRYRASINTRIPLLACVSTSASTSAFAFAFARQPEAPRGDHA